MPRSVNEREYHTKRKEILEAARQLIFTKGYDGMSIQDILSALQISKGAFYHYFTSKSDLLEALIEQLVDEARRMQTALIEDAQLSAVEKINRYFSTVGQWKTAQRDFLMALLHVWYTDENAIVRQKMLAKMMENIPLLPAIIQQGIREGVFRPAYPDQAAEVVLNLIYNLSDAFARRLLAQPTQTDERQRMTQLTAAYTAAIEHVLGAPAGSLRVIDQETIAEWMS